MGKSKGGKPSTGNAGSVADASPPRAWTAEEMAAARPLPLPAPTSGADDQAIAGTPHVGRGQVAPAGQPEPDE